MGVFDRQIATAARLIKAKGQLVTWRQVTDGTPSDAAKPWLPAAATFVDNSVYIVFLPEGSKDKTLMYLFGNTEVPKGKLLGLLAAQSFVPTLKDIVIRGSDKLGVRTLDPLAPNEQTILYTVGFDV